MEIFYILERSFSLRCQTTDSTGDQSVARAKEENEKKEVEEVVTCTGAALVTAQEESLRRGRQSSSAAVRRAELHAMSSGRDPRHVPLARDTTGDDVSKKMADLRMTPIDGRDFHSFQEARMRGRQRVNKLERELDCLTASSLSYQPPVRVSAEQLAREALQAAEVERSGGTYKRTVLTRETKARI